MASRFFAGKKRKIILSAATDDSTCPICLESCTETTEIDCCRHLFCFPCISHWGKIAACCPLCKLEFKKATCTAISGSLERKSFVPQRPATLSLMVDESESNDEDDGEEEEVDQNFGYEIDGFVVDEQHEDCLEYDHWEDETEEDRILDRADEILLFRTRRRKKSNLRESATVIDITLDLNEGETWKEFALETGLSNSNTPCIRNQQPCLSTSSNSYDSFTSNIQDCHVSFDSLLSSFELKD
jgi:hypothetical protein